MDITVREATVEDAEGVAAVYVSSAEHHHAIDPDFYRVPATEAVVARLRERIPDEADDSVLLVAQVNGQVAGSCRVALVPAPSDASMLLPRPGAELDIAVLAGFRGQGVGQALMSHGERWAAARGARLLMLNTHEQNTDAIRIYTERHSYRRVGLLLVKERDI